jgi:hypothetical protein
MSQSPSLLASAPAASSAGSSPPPDADAALFGPPEEYDPAEYRWVPVRRRPRRDGWTEEKQRRFIEVLADTGQVRLAAKAVGLSREGAYQLRRSAHGAAFARAWDAARAHAGALLEDIAFERAIEGREENVYDECGSVIATKFVPDNRLLTFLLRHLKPERYAGPAPAGAEPAADSVDICLRAMEPQLPAPAEEVLGAEQLADELLTADIADGVLPRFFSEMPPEQTEAQISAARSARGEAAFAKCQRGEPLDRDEMADMCHFIDPVGSAGPPRRRFR